MEEEKKTITELVQYYVDRYDVKIHEKGTYRVLRQQISRLLHAVRIGEITLFEAIKGEKGVRKISVEQFEKYCLSNWALYLLGKVKRGTAYVDEDNEALKADLARQNIDLEYEKEYIQIAEKAAKQFNRELESGDRERAYEDDGQPFATDEDVNKKAHEMMLEAIYGVFFDGFEWDKLKSDMEWQLLLDTGHKAENSPEVFKAIDRLEDYHNYIGKRKDN